MELESEQETENEEDLNTLQIEQKPTPTLDESEQQQQQLRIIASLQVSDGHVKCQACGSLQPIITDDTKLIRSSGSKRIQQLRSMIKQIERYHISGISAKKEKQELDELLEEQRKKDLLRRIPLYSTPITDHRWVCSSCYDKVYWLSRRTKKAAA